MILCTTCLSQASKDQKVMNLNPTWTKLCGVNSQRPEGCDFESHLEQTLCCNIRFEEIYKSSDCFLQFVLIS